MFQTVPNTPVVPYWRLSSFYFFYFAVVGAFVPYWGLYLASLGFSGKEIGVLSSVVLLTKIISPNIWGWLADKTGQRLRIIRWGSCLAFFIFLGVLIAKNFWQLAVVMVAYSFFWNAILAQFEVLTLAHLNDQPENYSKIRVWGSIGFIVFVFALGYVFDVYPIAMLPFILAVLFFAMWLSSAVIPAHPVSLVKEQNEGFLTIVFKPEVISFFIACFLMQVSHGPYYTFYSLYLEKYGYSKALIGQLWSLGVIAEVLLFMLMHHILPRYSVRSILLFSLTVAAGRWIIVALCPQSLVLLLFAQVLHAFTFGSFHAASIEMIRRHFSGGHEGQGQALYGAVSFGLGGSTGAFISGLLWEHSPSATFLMSSVACFIAVLVIWCSVKSLREETFSR